MDLDETRAGALDATAVQGDHSRATRGAHELAGDDEADERDDGRANHVRRGPALVILAIVAVVSIGGFLLAAFGASKPAPPTPAVQSSVAGIGALSARKDLARIAASTDPPADIVASLVVPAGSSVTGTSDQDRGVGTYDRSLQLVVPATMTRLRSFYRSELASHSWHIAAIDSTADGKGVALYATRQSNDGHYWEVGAVLEPASVSISPALGGATPVENTDLQLRLFQVDDAS